MRGINKAIIVGTLGQDPDVRFLPSGKPVANLRIATNERWKDQQGQQQERTEWHTVVYFDRMAEIAQQYLRKGSKVYVEGSLTTRKWQDQQGQDRYSTEIKGREMQMLDSPNQGQGGQAPQQSYQQSPQQQPPQGQPAPQPQGQYGAPQQQPNQHTPQGPGGGFDAFDDEIPFAAMHNICGG